MHGQDIVLLLKLFTLGEQHWTYATLSDSLFLSPSQIHAAMRSLVESGLCFQRRVDRRATLEFLIHGLRYVFPAGPRFLARGIPTSLAAPFFGRQMVYPLNSQPVMPWPEGSTNGIGVKPLYPHAPRSASLDAPLYELLALVDAIRAGTVRERDIARPLLEERLARR